jgi:hypothetical protein
MKINPDTERKTAITGLYPSLAIFYPHPGNGHANSNKTVKTLAIRYSLKKIIIKLEILKTTFFTQFFDFRIYVLSSKMG